MINSEGVIAYMSRYDAKVLLIPDGVRHHSYAGLCLVVRNGECKGGSQLVTR